MTFSRISVRTPILFGNPRLDVGRWDMSLLFLLLSSALLLQLSSRPLPLPLLFNDTDPAELPEVCRWAGDGCLLRRMEVVVVVGFVVVVSLPVLDPTDVCRAGFSDDVVDDTAAGFLLLRSIEVAAGFVVLLLVSSAGSFLRNIDFVCFSGCCSVEITGCSTVGGGDDVSCCDTVSTAVSLLSFW